ncbi:hypothetical protein LTR20_003356 [Exophiala xenobiotica]|nr:hypothetical protein LTR40_001361 [Exophiala xenobiotica]KAK5363592.1 hypothetical protein LTS13_009226 [Exophiala xenobiotica]KAK5402663.1 hypothetical protein LTR79_001391 [Exophiala xenobiotica]KAK5418922.1 hypothetical protein LTR90_003985 [Exophiala xenobiotica]KAK5466409.1 hypothetical protein LTR20_003356 [Exophiala xenobiotica]
MVIDAEEAHHWLKQKAIRMRQIFTHIGIIWERREVSEVAFSGALKMNDHPVQEDELTDIEEEMKTRGDVIMLMYKKRGARDAVNPGKLFSHGHVP